MKTLFIILLIGMIPFLAFSGGHHKMYVSSKGEKLYSSPTRKIQYNHMYNSQHEMYRSNNAIKHSLRRKSK